MTTLLYLIACLMSPSPLINLAESRDIAIGIIEANDECCHPETHHGVKRPLFKPMH